MSHVKPVSALFNMICIWLMFATISVGQAPLRLIDKTSWRSEPIRIQKLSIAGGKTIEIGKRFAAEGEWLKGLTVTVENVSTNESESIMARLGLFQTV